MPDLVFKNKEYVASCAQRKSSNIMIMFIVSSNNIIAHTYIIITELLMGIFLYACVATYKFIAIASHC